MLTESTLAGYAGTVAGSAHAEVELILGHEAFRAQRSPQGVGGALQRVVGTGGIDHRIHRKALVLETPAAAPYHAQFLALGNQFSDAPGVHLESLALTHVLDARGHVRRQAVAMHVPMALRVAQEAPPLRHRQLLPEPRREMADEGN